jgi:hypothetical protein
VVRASGRRLVLALLAAVAPAAGVAAELVVSWAPLAVPHDGYQVERRIDEPDAPFLAIARVGGDATRFVDRGVRPGVRYCYRVRGLRGERR